MSSETENQAVLTAALNRFKQASEYGRPLCEYITGSGALIVGAFEEEQKRWTLWLRPPAQLRDMFGLSLDLLLLVAPYRDLQPRIFDDISFAQHRRDRLDPDIALLASLDDRTPQMLQKRKGRSSIVSVSLERIQEGTSPKLVELLRSQLAVINHFNISRSVVAEEEFFGRQNEIREIENAIEVGEQHIGIFGLRKVGKTSLLKRVRVGLETKGWRTAIVDMNELKSDPGGLELALAKGLSPRGAISRTIDDALDQIEGAPGVLLVLDELDEILPSRIDPARSQVFLESMARIRAIAQRRASDNVLYPTVLAAGVDPAVFLRAVFSGTTNPLYGFAQLHFLGPMAKSELDTMIRTLGKRMGMRFGESTLQLLYDTYAGLPFLTRIACSSVHGSRPANRIPYEPTVEAVQAAIDDRSIASASSHVEEILPQFREWFPREADALDRIMSGEDVPPCDVPHAIAYGVLDKEARLRLAAMKRQGQS